MSAVEDALRVLELHGLSEENLPTIAEYLYRASAEYEDLLDEYQVLRNAVYDYLNEYYFYEASGESPQWAGDLEDLVEWVEPEDKDDIYSDDTE